MKRIGTGKLREQNDYRILECLADGMEVSKREVSDITGLTFATVGNILKDFLNNNIIIESETIQPKKGRPTVKYRLNPEYFYSLSLFIYRRNKKNYIHYRVHDAVVNRIEDNTNELRFINADVIKDYILNIVNRYNIKIIGIGVPSIIADGVIVASDIEELKNMNIEEIIYEATGIKTIVKNDMNYCAYGYYDMLEDKQDLCYITFPDSSGPGCGTMINGHLLEGRNHTAGELLYLPFFEYEKNKFTSITYTNHNIALCISCLYSIINPSLIILSGEEMKKMNINNIKQVCLEYIPKESMPNIIYKMNYDEDYLNGILKYIHRHYLAR